MADNVAITSGAGTTIATDQVGGNHYQIVKLADGTGDSADIIKGDSTNGLDVDVTRVTGTVTVDGSGVTQPVSGTVTANIGTAGTVATSANQTSGGQKTQVVGTTGQVAEVSANALDVRVVGGSVSVTSATEYTEGDVDASLTGVVAQAEGPSNTVTPLQVDASKHLQVDIAASSATVTVDSSNLDIRDLTSVSDSVEVKQATASNLKTAATLDAETTKVIGTTRVQGNVGGVMDAVAGATKPANALQVGGSDGTNLLPLSVDNFGRLINRSETILNDLLIAEHRNQVEVDFSVAFDAAVITNTTSGTGAATAASSGKATYATGTGAAGSARGITIQTILYRPGADAYSYFTAAFTTPSDVNGFQRIGPYTDTNGFFVGYEGMTFKATVRQNSSDTGTAQASFSVDKLAGAAGSKFTRGGVIEAVDWTKLNVFRIRYSWFGAAPIQFEILSPDGTWIVFHRIAESNTSVNPSIWLTTLPISIHASKTGADATNLIISSGCVAGGTTDPAIKLTDTILDTSLAPLTRSVIAGHSTAGGGSYINVKVNTSGALSTSTTLNDGTDTALVTAAGELNVLATAQPGVDIGDVTINNAAGAAAVNVQDGGNTITVDGTVDTELTTADLDTGAGTDTRAVVGLIGSKSGGGQLIPGDATAGLKVDLGTDNDVTVTSGSITATQATGTNLHTVIDSGTVTTVSTVTNLSQQGGVAISLNTGVRDTGTQRVTIATNDVVPITDNSGSLTVDQPTGTNLHTVVDSGTITTVSTLTGTTTLTPGTGATNLGKAEDGAHTSGDVGVMALGVGNVAQTTLAADGDYIPLAVDTKGNVLAVGNIAHDGVDAGNPVKIGAKAVDLGATPTAVAAADRTDLLSTRAGQLFTIGGHPNVLSKNLQVTDADGAQTDTAIVTVAAGTAIVVTAIEVVCDNANTVDVSCRIGFGTANTPAADAAGVIFFHPGIAPGSGAIKGNGSGILGIGASDEDLRVTCEDPVTGSISITIAYYTIAIG